MTASGDPSIATKYIVSLLLFLLLPISHGTSSDKASLKALGLAVAVAVVVGSTEVTEEQMDR